MSNVNTALEASEQKTNYGERFASKVMSEFKGSVGSRLEISNYQRMLIQNYFIGIDRALKKAEEARSRKKKGQDPLTVEWKNVDLQALALGVVHFARIGLDMAMDNHLFPVVFKNNKTNKYDVNLMVGYVGKQYIVEKYAIDKPVNVTFELVYANDTFKPIKKTLNNKVENYEFEINNPFDRGKIVGGFGYIEYADPIKNKLVIMTLKDIMKRKPAYASTEFWGGEKDRWEAGNIVGKERIEGWLDEMCLKTLKRAVFDPKYIPIDPMKIDESYLYMKHHDDSRAAMAVRNEIIVNANQGELIGFDEQSNTAADGIAVETDAHTDTPYVDEDGEIVEPEQLVLPEPDAGDY